METQYRWFYTSSGKLVLAGKSSLQNDELLKEMKSSNKEYIVMHTSTPGSPFVVIQALVKQIQKIDLEEVAIYTGCFSRAWREGKKKAKVDIFTLSQLHKAKSMKVGTWGVQGKVEKRTVVLSLVLTKQKNKLRAVPEITTKNALLRIKPGKVDKQKMVPKLQEHLKEKFTQEDILSALPAGGVSIVKK